MISSRAAAVKDDDSSADWPDIRVAGAVEPYEKTLRSQDRMTRSPAGARHPHGLRDERDDDARPIGTGYESYQRGFQSVFVPEKPRNLC
jgi:hypothetical protein